MPEEGQSSPTPGRRTRRSAGDGKPSSVSSSAPLPERRVDRNATGLRRSFVDVLAWTITTTWAIGFGVDMVNVFPKWDLPAPIWGLMTVVAGAAFVAPALKKEDQS